MRYTKPIDCLVCIIKLLYSVTHTSISIGGVSPANLRLVNCLAVRASNLLMTVFLVNSFLVNSLLFIL